jgi:hypothetical protein
MHGSKRAAPRRKTAPTPDPLLLISEKFSWMAAGDLRTLNPRLSLGNHAIMSLLMNGRGARHPVPEIASALFYWLLVDWIAEPDAGPASVLIYELDARRFECVANREIIGCIH